MVVFGGRLESAIHLDGTGAYWQGLLDELDELLTLILHPGEDEYFDSGWVDTREWIDMARAGFDGTDFDWLMSELRDRRRSRRFGDVALWG